MRKRVRFASLLVVAGLATMGFTARAADVHRCIENGKAAYSDKPCASDAAMPAPTPGQTAPQRGKMKSGTTFAVSDAVVQQCWKGIRKFARDPTSAEYVGYSAQVGEDGFPWLAVNGAFTNKFGAPEERMVRCRLNYDLTINKPVTDEELAAFYRSQTSP